LAAWLLAIDLQKNINLVILTSPQAVQSATCLLHALTRARVGDLRVGISASCPV